MIRWPKLTKSSFWKLSPINSRLKRNKKWHQKTLFRSVFEVSRIFENEDDSQTFILILGNFWSCCCYWRWVPPDWCSRISGSEREMGFIIIIFGNSGLSSTSLSTECSHNVHKFSKKRMTTVFDLIFGNSRLFTHGSSKYMYLRANFTPNRRLQQQILHIYTSNLWDLQKRIDSNRPFLASRVAKTINS